tara:strand:+ start:280 stop:426 length:147 start_codon:yes stop_codon:yes gene_type:complete
LKLDITTTRFLSNLIRKYPRIVSGRKNFKNYNIRINKVIRLINKIKKN